MYHLKTCVWVAVAVAVAIRHQLLRLIQTTGTLIDLFSVHIMHAFCNFEWPLLLLFHVTIFSMIQCRASLTNRVVARQHNAGGAPQLTLVILLGNKNQKPLEYCSDILTRICEEQHLIALVDSVAL